jgi:hypothetical protein
MVYRLIPTHRFSRFGSDDLMNPELLKGAGLGLLVALVVLSVVGFVSLNKDNTSLVNYVEINNDGSKKLNWRKYGLHLVLPLLLSFTFMGAVLGHLGMNKLTDMENMKKVGMYASAGLLLALVILALLGHFALGEDNKSLRHYVKLENGEKKLNWTKFVLELCMPLCVSLTSLGVVVSEFM